MAIEELGWDDNKRIRNVVNVRCNRAITMLGKMMGDARCDYRDVYVPSVQKAPDQPSEPYNNPSMITTSSVGGSGLQERVSHQV